MELFLSIVLLIVGLLQIILFFKVWGMCNDVRSLKQNFVKEPISNEITDIDGWINGGDGKTESEDEDKFTIGAEVSAMVDKNGVHMGDVLKITKVGKGYVLCSLDGKSVGKFKTDEVFLIK